MQRHITNRSTHRLVQSATGPARKALPAARDAARLEPLEGRLLFSGSQTITAFSGGNLTVTVPVADHVTITEAVAKGGNDVAGPYTFTVTDSKNSIGGKGTGAFSSVKNISVNVSASGSIISVQGIDDNAQNQATGIPGDLSIVDTQPNNKLSVEVHDGLTVGGGVFISNSGKGSTFVPETIMEGNSKGQVETGVFLDPNRKGSYGGVNIVGSGSVGVDGIKVFGSVNVNLGSAASSFVADAEWVYRQDPDSPPWTTLRQDPSVIGGNLTVNGGSDVEVYNSVVGRYTTIAETPAPTTNEYVLLGADSLGNGLSISASGKSTGVFADFTTVGGNTSIFEGNGDNVIGTDSTLFAGTTTFTQGNGADFTFIDSETALAKASVSFAGGLPTDSKYISDVTTYQLLPSESGSTFGGLVKATQGAGKHQLEIAQDATPITIFATAGSTFTAGTGTTIDASLKALGLPLTVVGYGAYKITGF